MGINVHFEMDLNVYDEKEFRAAARERALKDGLSTDAADEFLDEEKQSLGDCAVMLIDPGTSPDGADIVGSSAEAGMEECDSEITLTPIEVVTLAEATETEL